MRLLAIGFLAFQFTSALAFAEGAPAPVSKAQAELAEKVARVSEGLLRAFRISEPEMLDKVQGQGEKQSFNEAWVKIQASTTATQGQIRDAVSEAFFVMLQDLDANWAKEFDSVDPDVLARAVTRHCERLRAEFKNETKLTGKMLYEWMKLAFLQIRVEDQIPLTPDATREMKAAIEKYYELVAEKLAGER